MKSNNVSVVIVTYNCEEVIKDCILSCLKNDISEIIVVDNASKDRTIETLAKIEDSRLIYIRNRKNLGFTKACNQGIDASKEKYVMLLNPDACLQPGSIEVLLKYLENHPEVGIVAPSLYFPNGEFQNYTRTFPSVIALWVETFIPMKYWHNFKSFRKYTCQDIDFTKVVKVEQPAGAALVLKKKWQLDESYFIYGSDVDLCKSVIDEGNSIVQLPDAKIIHHQSKGGTENKTLRTLLKADNYFGMNYYFKKHKQYSNYFLYKVLFTFSLTLRFGMSCFQNSNERKERWLLLKAFVLNYNFETLWKEQDAN
jgi:GT2 family glycosyltransferase